MTKKEIEAIKSGDLAKIIPCWQKYNAELSLSYLYELRNGILKSKEFLAEFRAKAYAPRGMNLTGMPRGSSYKTSTLEENAIEIAHRENVIEQKEAEYWREYAFVFGFINTIPNSELRLIMKFRFLDGMMWENVARAVGGGHTEESVKKACSRYLNKLKIVKR